VRGRLVGCRRGREGPWAGLKHYTVLQAGSGPI
jgi:hypothetical protein